MTPVPLTPAAMARPHAAEILLSGHWTALGMGGLDRTLRAMVLEPGAGGAPMRIDGSQVAALDTVGVWILQRLLQRLRGSGYAVSLDGWSPRCSKLIERVARHHPAPALAAPPAASLPERTGRATLALGQQLAALLAFIGEASMAVAGCLARPARMRWRPVLYNIGSAGVEALPIVGLLAFLLGVVVAYQAADQLRQYGANIFIADLVGVSMLREFAPLITAIIVAGRSGSAYAAQIGSMSVNQEVDAMRTLGIPPIDMLVVPKILALIIALPLLTLFSDVLGVLGGMIMARAQLGVGFADFLDRLVNAVSMSTYMSGLAKAPVFAVIIAVVGCFQGFATRGGADSVGRQTTRSVVQSIFLVVVVDALFSVLFAMVGI